MPESFPCGGPVDILADVATGAATGADRARVLAHVATCEHCRHELSELSRTADDLLLIAPEHEPPAGFEAAVLDRIAAQSRTTGPSEDDPRIPRPGWSRRWARSLVLAAVALGIALASGGAVWQATQSDRDLAAAYQRTLDVANGQYFSAAPFLDDSGEQVGHAFLYQGEPSWVFVVLDEVPASGAFDIVTTTAAGDDTIGVCAATTSGCGAGATVDVKISEITRVRLVSQEDGTAFSAPLPGRGADWAR